MYEVKMGFERSVFQIRGQGGAIVGTGFAIEPAGLVVTCAHVVNQALGHPLEATERPIVTIPLTFIPIEHESLLTTVVAWSPLEEKDVAVLKLKVGLPKGAVPLPLGRQPASVAGHKFRCYGFPEGHDQGLIGTGTLQGVPSSRLLQLESDEVTIGFSGSPLLDDNVGQVIGMVGAVAPPDRLGRLIRTAFGIPSERIASTYSQIGLSPQPVRIIGRFYVSPFDAVSDPVMPLSADELDEHAYVGECAQVSSVIAHEVIVRNGAQILDGVFAYNRAIIGDWCIVHRDVLAVNEISFGDSQARNVTAPLVRLTTNSCTVDNVLACSMLETNDGLLSPAHVVKGMIICEGNIAIATGAKHQGGIISGSSIDAHPRVETRFLIAQDDLVIGDNAKIMYASSQTSNVTVGHRTQIGRIVAKGNVVIGSGCRVNLIRASGNVDIGSHSIVVGQVVANGDVYLRRGADVEQLFIVGNLVAESGVRIGMPHLESESGIVQWKPPLHLGGEVVTDDNRFVVTPQSRFVPFKQPLPPGSRCAISNLLNCSLFSLFD